MKFLSNITAKQVCGNNVLILNQGRSTTILNLNESSFFLWEQFKDADSFEVSDMVDALTKEYDVDNATAEADITNLLGEWKKAGVLL